MGRQEDNLGSVSSGMGVLVLPVQMRNNDIIWYDKMHDVVTTMMSTSKKQNIIVTSHSELCWEMYLYSFVSLY